MNFREMAQQTESYIIERRRYYHAHPELSEQEKETTRAIMADLREMGLEPVALKTAYGCYADIVGGQPGKTVALRADIDALPVPEETGLEFASCNEGVMHACGHDTHIAMLLGAAKMLVSVKDELKGTVRLLFQAAEETGVGAKAVLAEGVLKDVDAIYGSHIWGNFDAPYVSVEGGNRMASAASFEIEVEGMSAHGSAPNLGVDAIVAASAIVMALQTYVSRNNDPLNPLVLTVGTFNSGSRWNIVSGKATLTGTVRTFSKELLTEAPRAMKRIIEGTAAAYGAKATMKFDWLTVPVINDQEHLVTLAQNAVKKLYGDEGLAHLDTMMGGEDFSYYMLEVPAVFSFLGSRNPEKGLVYTNHHEKYTVDEDVLKRGAALHAQFAYDFLNEE